MPTAAYLATMGRGIADSHGWGAAEITDYLLARPGIGDEWDEASVRELLLNRLRRPTGCRIIATRHPEMPVPCERSVT